MKIVSLIFFALIIAIAIIDYAIKIAKSSNQRDFFEVSIPLSRKISDMESVVADTRELILLNMGIRIPQFSNNNETTPTIQSDYAALKYNLDHVLDSLETNELRM
jgi:hypothetical protein